jgi:ribulose-bisphosphate carboxylase large chain
MFPMSTLEPIRAHYRLHLRSGETAREKGEAIAREQTLEVPPGASTPEIDRTFLGRVVEVVPAGEDPHVERVVVEYAPELFDGALTQFLNVVWGNVSLMDGVVLEELELPPWALAHFPGPRFGVPGIRMMVGNVQGRPLVSSALKPVGLSPAQLAELARRLTRAGVDIIKDDHGLADQASAPFAARVRAVNDAILAVNEAWGSHTVYFPNVTAGVDVMPRRAEQARSAGCPGVVVCPGLTGLDALRALREADLGLALMAHPSHANTSPNADRGIAPDLLMGTLWRLAGADAAVYVNARGRFAWPVEACQAVNRRARGPLGKHLPAFPVPAGGIQAEEVGHWFTTYGSDTLLLIGGSLLEAENVEAAAREVVKAAVEAGKATTAGGPVAEASAANASGAPVGTGAEGGGAEPTSGP